jgi:hypothetical protein
MPHVIIPVAEFPVAAKQDRQALPEKLQGVRLGILNNQKPNATELLEGIVARLQPMTESTVNVRTKSPPAPAAPADVDYLSQETDMVIIGSGD